MEEIIYAKLIAIKNGTYTMYVFLNLDTNEYLMCTKLPNWKTPDIEINESGYLQYEKVKAGDEYFDLNSDKKSKYLYSNVYFKNFINKTIEMNNKLEIIM